MTQDEERKPGDEVRRIGPKDRKTHLDSAGPLFPDDDTAGEQNDFEEVSLPDFEAEHEQSRGEVAESDQNEAPQERFPPLPDELPDLDEEDQLVHEEIVADEAARHVRRGGDWRHNLVAIFFLLATVALVIYFAVIWQYPYSRLNPLAPPTPFVIITETPDYSRAVVSNVTPLPAESTAEVTQEAADTQSEATPTTSAPVVQSGDFPFALAESGVIYAPNSNGRGCDWSSIAGTVTGLQGEPLDDYGVQITDAEDSTRLDVKVFSGSALTFGEGGFELPLGGVPQQGQFIVRLYSPAGVPLSDEYLVFTRDTCEENVTIVNFEQVSEF